MIKVKSTSIDGFLVIEPNCFKDERGFFLETYQEDIYKAAGITEKFVQDNQSRSMKGVIRGMHFQVNRPQAQIVTIMRGSVFQGMRFHTAANKLCWQAAMGKSISVWSTAYDQKRPYLDLFDASRSIEFIIRNNLFDGRIYNVLSENATVHQVVDIIREFITDLSVEFVDNRIMNQLSYELSCDRFKDKGFSFTGSLRRGIEETISLLRN